MIHDGLADVDRLHLGTLRVWGVGNSTVMGVTLQRGSDQPTDLPDMSYTHNKDTEVRRPSWTFL